MPTKPEDGQPEATRFNFEQVRFSEVRFAGIIIRRPAPANTEWPNQPTPAAKGFLIDTFL